ncbi:threo-3-hydroxy-L-aspartate ammonia-lyase (plasmid) [Acaryochloris sp. 'Moss Beach']|nr:threo-3-hydroxy-L-aspartate ammonia-lyase [Acaryochloris sp. 'Moss Beach']
MLSYQNLQVNYTDIEHAYRKLQGVAYSTPVFTSATVNKLTQCQVYFKCENFQRAGAFKFRGAYNALAQLSHQESQQGVITFSSGNHAQACALAGQLLSVQTTILMPEDAPAVKQAATCGYGGNVIFYDRHTVNREELGREIAHEKGLKLIPPYNHPHIVAGQGTAAMELIQEVGPLDRLYVPCGGGGLLSGSAIAAKALSPNCRVVGVEPEKADDATRSFQTQTLQTVENPDTVADGARTPCLGTVTFPLVLHYVDAMQTVSEESILKWMLFIWERLKVVVEPTGALAAAAVLEQGAIQPHQRVGVILSGGNVDLAALSTLFATR